MAQNSDEEDIDPNVYDIETDYNWLNLVIANDKIQISNDSLRFSEDSFAKIVNIKSNISTLEIEYSDLKILNIYHDIKNLYIAKCDELTQINIHAVVDSLVICNKDGKYINLCEYLKIHASGKINSIDIRGLDFIPEDSMNSNNSVYESLFDIFRDISKVELCDIDRLKSITFLKNTKEIILSNLSEITDLSSLSNANILKVDRLSNVKCVESLKNINHLELANMNKITDVSCLKNVKKLKLAGLEEVRDISMLKNYDLSIDNMTLLKTCSFSNIEKLSLYYNYDVESLLIYNVNTIVLCEMEKLKNVSFNNVNSIIINSCKRLKSIDCHAYHQYRDIDDTDDTDTRNIHISHCINLEQFSSNYCIKHMSIEHCNKIISIIPFRCVNTLELIYMENLTNESFTDLVKLGLGDIKIIKMRSLRITNIDVLFHLKALGLLDIELYNMNLDNYGELKNGTVFEIARNGDRLYDMCLNVSLK